MNGENPNAGFGGSPTYTVNAPLVSIADNGKSAYSFTVTYTSQNASAFDESTVDTNDVTVTNSSGTALAVTAAAVTGGTGTEKITVTYTVTPPGGTWDAADNGGYSIALANAAVSTADGKTTGGNNFAGSFTADLSPAPLPVYRTVTLTDNDDGITGFFYKVNDAAAYTPYTGVFTVSDGDKLELKASVADGYTFEKWADGITANPYSLASVTYNINYDPTSVVITNAYNTPTAITANGITATVTYDKASPQAKGTNIAATITLTGTATATGMHTVSLTSTKAGLTGTAQTSVVTAGQNLTATPVTKTITFTVPAQNVDDLSLMHTFTPLSAPGQIEYRIEKGANGKWEKGDASEFLFTANGELAKFAGVMVDGNIISEENYTKQSGNTGITLKPAYLRTLSIGTHTLYMIFTDGYAETTFTITAASGSGVPATGDNSTPVFYMGIMLLAGAGLAVSMVLAKKKRKA